MITELEVQCFLCTMYRISGNIQTELYSMLTVRCLHLVLNNVWSRSFVFQETSVPINEFDLIKAYKEFLLSQNQINIFVELHLSR